MPFADDTYLVIGGEVPDQTVDDEAVSETEVSANQDFFTHSACCTVASSGWDEGCCQANALRQRTCHCPCHQGTAVHQGKYGGCKSRVEGNRP